MAIALVVQFVIWYLDDDHVGQPFLFWTLSVALGYKLMHLLYEWYHYLVMAVPVRPETTRDWKVDMFTTYVAGEPKEMLIRTLRAMVAIQYPHTTYLCDEADDPELQRVCKELGIVHVYRGEEKTNAKAGNINYALRNHASGEIVVILDPDHVPVPEFIDRVLPYFEDPKIGFVQCIQAYYNQGESLIARGAAEQTYMFYGPMMLGMQRRGTVQAIGANCTFRRAALDSIGGHAGGLCEDMHTSMRIHSKSWTSVYIPELLSRGKTPANISDYYHQQLKWSRGAFELLFEVYPRLVKGFTWSQRIHYLLIPLYFLAGVISLVDIGVPIFSLLTYHVPLFIDFEEFAIRIVPVLISISLIRHYVQRFVLDQQEEGFHFMGGILRVGTWWVYLLGFIYALFRVKVPYIPTNKANQISNHWVASVPNLIVIALSFFAVFVGLKNDFTPFSWVMAGFACINILLLGFIVIVSQQKLLSQALQYLAPGITTIYRNFLVKPRHVIFYRLLRNSFFALMLTFLTFSFSSHHFFGLGSKVHLSDLYPKGNKLAGMSFLSPVNEGSNANRHRVLSAFSVDDSDPQLVQKIESILDRAREEKRTPFIKLFITRDPTDTDSIRTHNFSTRFASFVDAFRKFQLPLLLEPVFEESETDTTIFSCYRVLKRETQNGGAGNASLVWLIDSRNERHTSDDIDLFLVDNSARSADGLMIHTEKQYPVKPTLLILERNDDRPASFFSLRQLNAPDLPVVGWITKSAEQVSIGRDSLPNQGNIFPVSGTVNDRTPAPIQVASSVNNGSVISRKATNPDEFEWQVAGNSFYVKGVVYNPEHTWRDGQWPLTRRRLQDDFARIKAMGGNTISRENPTIYDKNIFQVAEEMGLHVLYGFSFDPAIDYLYDTLQVDRIKRETISKIKSVKDEKAILSWVLGAGTWELLSEHYYQPHLTEVRLAYMRMIGDLAKAVREIDPFHPVMTGLFGDDDFRTALDNMEIALPYLDAVAVNASHPDHLEYIRNVLDNWGGEIPYLVNEFGPNVNYHATAFVYDEHGRIMEPSSYEKGRLYSKLWKEIENDAGHNLGGLAYCWRDRFEGTATFSGITDGKGRQKPAYFSLKEVWTGESQKFPLADLTLKQETIFANESVNMVYSAMSANNLDKTLTYQWFICREEYLETVHRLRVNYKSLPSRKKFWLINEFNENIAHTLHVPAGPPAAWYFGEKVKPLQRIYLYIYDEENHVVTASYPIHSDKGL